MHYDKRYKINYTKRWIIDRIYYILPYLWLFLGILSILIIIIIGFTNIRFGEFEKAKDYNELILAIFVGIFASCFFFWINEYIPQRELNKTMKDLIDNDIRTITNKLRDSIMIIYNPYQNFFQMKQIPKFEQFLTDFEKFDFNEVKYDKVTYKQIFIQNQSAIKDKSKCLMNEYNRFMTIAQLRYIRNILKSTFIYQELEPLDQCLQDDLKICFPNNQQEIGASLYFLYKLKVPR